MSAEEVGVVGADDNGADVQMHESSEAMQKDKFTQQYQCVKAMRQALIRMKTRARGIEKEHSSGQKDSTTSTSRCVEENTALSCITNFKINFVYFCNV